MQEDGTKCRKSNQDKVLVGRLFWYWRDWLFAFTWCFQHGHSGCCCLFLFLSGLRPREGYETNDEEKIKNKFKPASVKEPPSQLRLLQIGSSGPQDNHLSQVLSNEINLTPTRTVFWLGFLHFVPSSCIACKLVSSRRGLEPFAFSLQYTLG